MRHSTSSAILLLCALCDTRYVTPASASRYQSADKVVAFELCTGGTSAAHFDIIRVRELPNPVQFYDQVQSMRDIEGDSRDATEIFATSTNPHEIFTAVLPLLAVAIQPSQHFVRCRCTCCTLRRAHRPVVSACAPRCPHRQGWRKESPRVFFGFKPVTGNPPSKASGLFYLGILVHKKK